MMNLQGIPITRECLVKIERGIQHIQVQQLRAIRDALETTSISFWTDMSCKSGQQYIDQKIKLNTTKGRAGKAARPRDVVRDRIRSHVFFLDLHFPGSASQQVEGSGYDQ